MIDKNKIKPLTTVKRILTIAVIFNVVGNYGNTIAPPPITPKKNGNKISIIYSCLVDDYNESTIVVILRPFSFNLFTFLSNINT